MKRVTTSVCASIVLASVCLLCSCDGLFGPSIPSELHGEWSWTIAHYYERFTITATTVSYFGQSTEYAGYAASWSEEILEVHEADQILEITGDGNGPMYLPWHLSGNTLYLDTTNPGDAYPILADEWWLGSGYKLSRE